MTEPTVSVEYTAEALKQWAPYERMLRQWLGTVPGSTPEQTDSLLSQVRPTFLKWVSVANAGGPQAAGVIKGKGWSVQLPGGSEGAFDRVQQWIATLTFGLLQEIALLIAERDD